MDALLLFKADLATYCRAYTFLSQIFDYGNTDFEKRAIFFKHLGRLLKYGREREGVDLSEVRLSHHNLKPGKQKNLGLSGKDVPKLAPMGEAGSGSVQEKQKAKLNEIIEKVNELFGGDTTDGDQLSWFKALDAKVQESEVLKKQAANNTKEQFATSPDYDLAVKDAYIETLDAHTKLSTEALNSDKVHQALKSLLLGAGGLYESLREQQA